MATTDVKSAPQAYTDFQYIIAYTFIIIILMLVAKTKLGYNTLYYSLLLFAFSMVLIHSNFILTILEPISGKSKT